MSFNDECPICFEENYYNFSSTLKCGHKMCSQCLVSHTLKAQELNKLIVECPFCRSIIIVIDEEYEIHQRRQLDNIIRYTFMAIIMIIIPYILFHIFIYLLQIK